MKTILITGIGGLTPRSVAGIIRENHPDYRLIGVDVNKLCMPPLHGGELFPFHRATGGREAHRLCLRAAGE